MIRLRPAVVEAIIDCAEYIGRSSPSAADRFLDATQATFRLLEEMPGMGHRYESARRKLTGVKVWSVKGYRNHLIFYRPLPGGVEILQLLHGARDIPTVLGEAIRRGEL